MVRRSQRYDDAFASVKVVVCGADPIGLLAGGSPDDEYDQEIARLVALVLRTESFDQGDVDAVWRGAFGDEYAMEGSAQSTSMTDALAQLRSLLLP